MSAPPSADSADPPAESVHATDVTSPEPALSFVAVSSGGVIMTPVTNAAAIPIPVSQLRRRLCRFAAAAAKTAS
jgi:hypothetical protein